MKADLDAARAKRQTIFISLHHGAVSHAVGPAAHGGSELILNEVIPEPSALLGLGIAVLLALRAQNEKAVMRDRSHTLPHG